MSKYYMLLEKNIIDFDKLLLEKYSLLGLDEIEVIILIKLNKILQSNNKFSITQLSKNMTVTEDIIRNKLVDLINNQFITLKLINKNEIYSLDDTYNKLSNILEKEENKETKEEQNTDISKVVSLLEKEFKKMLSPLELELVHKWVNEDKYSYDKIYVAIMDTLKLKKKNIQYIDLLLNKNTNETPQAKNEGLQDLFNQVYGKIK